MTTMPLKTHRRDRAVGQLIMAVNDNQRVKAYAVTVVKKMNV